MLETGIMAPDFTYKKFDRLGYIFREDVSGETEYVFERAGK